MEAIKSADVSEAVDAVSEMAVAAFEGASEATRSGNTLRKLITLLLVLALVAVAVKLVQSRRAGSDEV